MARTGLAPFHHEGWNAAGGAGFTIHWFRHGSDRIMDSLTLRSRYFGLYLAGGIQSPGDNELPLWTQRRERIRWWDVARVGFTWLSSLPYRLPEKSGLLRSPSSLNPHDIPTCVKCLALAVERRRCKVGGNMQTTRPLFARVLSIDIGRVWRQSGQVRCCSNCLSGL